MWIAQGRKLRDAAGDATKDAVHFDERTGAPRVDVFLIWAVLTLGGC